MEMDRQTIMVLCCAIIGLTLFGGVYLSSPKPRDSAVRHAYAQDDIRYKLQKEDAKKPKAKKKKPAATPIISSSESSGGSDESSSEESSEEPSVDDGGSQEEPSLE
jgi:hypothetical protein